MRGADDIRILRFYSFRGKQYKRRPTDADLQEFYFK